MANTENHEEFVYSAKRKPDLARRETEGEGGDRSGKSLKVEPLGDLNHTGGDGDGDGDGRSEPGNGDAPGEGSRSGKAVVLEEERADVDADTGVEEEEEEDDDYDDDDENDDDDDEDDEDEEEEDEGGEVGVKGKGILKDDKGKGKLIVEEEEELSGDSSDDYGNVGVPSESDSDLSDDPLAEVDLDNILPSRTRRRTAQPGVFIARDRKDGGGDRS